MSVRRGSVVVAVGLRAEARIAARWGTKPCCGQGAGFATALRRAAAENCSGILSFGIAGGLDPRLRPGMCVVATRVLTDQASYDTDANWSKRLLDGWECVQAPVLSVDRPVGDAATKHALHQRTGAAAVDMESGVAAAIAREHDLPFAVLRVIADSATRRLPSFASRCVRDDGSIDARSVLAQLWQEPSDIFAGLRLAEDAWVARRALARAGQRLGEGLGLLDLG